ncbi:MAG: FAD-dependent tricarballylate dehydrogenase TcuA [Gemmatimonas sp.]|nr:FAD-dependent tricarballylate dehydrogenase TcuA [Gemmatimonas sp.]
MIDLTQELDVLVAGGGNAALCAAIAARRQGASVLILEAAPRFFRGGNTRHTRNLRIAHDEPNGVLTGAYAADEYWQDLKRVTAENTNDKLARQAIDQSRELMAWLTDQGVHFQPPFRGTLHLGRTNAFFLGGGRAMLNALYSTAERLGVGVLYEAEVVDLSASDGVFEAAHLVHRGAHQTVRAKALVAAAGGYEANIAWLKESWGDQAENFLIRGTPYNRGTVLRRLLERGARPVGEPKQCHAVAIDARSPRFDGGIVTRLDCIVFGIVVNREAVRFYDEGEDLWTKRYAIWGRLLAEQPDQIGYVIIDSKAVNRFMPSVFPPMEGSSIGELANQLGLKRDRLTRTVNEFNEAVQPGTFDETILDDCRTEGIVPPKSHWATRIDTPPFYGYPLRPGITFTYFGVAVNEDAKIGMQAGGASENMFAAGEIMVGNILGQGYLGGVGMTIGSVFGRIAGKGAAAHAAR